MTNRTPQRIAVGCRWRGFSKPYRLLCALLASLQLLLPSLVVALPSDGNVVGGHADIQQISPTQLNIHQITDRAIINWQSFSTGVGETVRFDQPSINSIAMNRVTGIDPSVLLGNLEANGRIFLLNPNGILFGAGAQINVGGLLATTLQIRDDDFMAGRYHFAQDPLKGFRTVINRGTIQVSDHGFVFLTAPGVSNEGLIVANLGKVVLGSGQALTVDLMGDGLINYALSGKVLDQVMGPDGATLNSAVSNSGTIQADGGHIILQAKAAGDIFSSVVNQSGVIRARSIENHGGVVQLLGGDETLVAATAAGAMRPAGNVSGAVINTGTIDVAAGSPNAAQGSVTMVGERVGQFGSIVATGAEGANGGDVVIASTTRTLLAGGSTIDVSGIGHSSGGRLRVWSDQDTFFNVDATILARGGELGGNGGFIELSGKENLGYAGSVNALAPFGLAGTLLLDPRNITIATAGGSAYNPGVNNLFGNTPASDVIITPASINAAAANVVLQANNDITVTNAIAMTNNGVGITMQAGRDILVNAGVSTTNGSISMTANDSSSMIANRADGTAGDIIFGAGANLSSGTGNITLTIDPATAGNYDPGSITTVRNLTTTAGNITLNSPNTVSLSGAVNAGSGIVSINANNDGAGAQNFTMNAGSSIATTNTGANAVQVIVNNVTGGTGAASLRGSITTGNGGTATVSTRGQAGVGGNTTGGAITQGAVLTVNTGAAGTVALATGAAASSITLNTAGNDFTGSVGVSRAFNVALRDANAFTLDASTISGTFGVTTVGAVTQTGALTVTGTSTLAAGAANNITLNNAGNNFSTVAITNGNNVALTDANALILGASTVSGTLGVTTAGALTQSGVLTVTGVTTLAAGAANNINLATSANNFSTVGITSGNNVSLRDTNALVLGASTVNGTLALTTGGALSQSGALNVTGATSFTATAANTDILLGTQANNFGGALSFAGTLGNFRDVSLRNVNAGATVPALAGLTALRNVTLTYNNAPVALPAFTLTAGGSLNVTAGGVITDSGILIVPGTTTLAAGANNITLDNANNFTGAVSVTSGNNVTLNDINALILGASTISGTLGVTTNGALTQSGALAVTGATTVAAGIANNITLSNVANNFSTVGITSGNNVALRDANALNLAASTVSGTFGVTTAGAVTQTGALTVTGTTTLAAGAANNITLGGANDFSTVAVTSGNNVTLNDTNALILGASTVSGTFGVTAAGALTDSGNLVITGTTTLAAGAGNNITLNNANNFSAVAVTSGNNVTLNDTNALILDASTISGTFGVTTVGAVTQTGALTVTGTSTLAAGAANNITLNNAGNNFSTVAITNGNNVALTDANALILGASTVSGTLGVTTAGALTQSGVLTVTGVTTLAAGAANNINLATSANNFSTVGITSGNNVSLRDTNALVLGASTVNGTLALTTGGALSQSGALNVTGATSFTATAANTDILLGTQANNFGGALSFAGTLGNFRDVSLRNVNAGATVPALAGLTALRNVTLTYNNAPVALPAFTLTAGGSLNVTAGGVITDSGILIVPGTTTLAAGANNITLDNANNFTGAVSVTSGNNVTLNDINALILGASTISGTLGVTTNGALTQSGALAVTGATTVAAGIANNITLSNVANNFSTVGITSGNNVALTDTNALDLGASTVSGNLVLTTGGTLSQTGALAVTGTTSFTATAANTDILLDTQANNFVGVLSFAGTQANFRDVQLRNVNAGATVPVLAGLTNLRNLTLMFDNAAMTLPALTASGTLNLTAGGAINQSGVLAVGGTTTLATTVAGSDILLDTQANNFVGAISFGGTLGNIRDVGLRNVNAGATVPSLAGLTNLRNLTLTFDNAPVALPSLTLTAGGNLNVTAGGSITETGAVTVPGMTTLATTVAGSDILLNTQANNFGGAITFGGTQTNVRDLGLRNVNAGVTVPALAGLTNLRNLTLTFDTAPMVLPSLTVSGSLTATAGGLISQSGALNVAGAAGFDTVAAATLGSVTLANGGALTLNTSTVGGNLTVTTAAGDLTLPAGQTLTVVGDATLSPAGTVNLLGTTRIGGTQSFVGGTGSTFVLGADTNLNALALPAAGDITVSLTGSTASFAGAPLLPQAITLGNAGNSFGGPVSVTTAAPAFTGTTTNTYNLTQSAPVNLNVGQGLTVTDLGGTAGPRGNITLTNAGNIFNTVTFTGGNIAWAETGPVTIGGVSANAGVTSTGTLSITATGLITQTGAVTTGGASTVAAGANDITLTNAANNFSTVGITSGNNVALTDADALDLGASTISGTLNVITNGALTQSGALSVTGTTTLAAGAANNITLNNATNNFSTVGITSGNNVTLVDANVLNLAASTVSGGFTVTTGGTLTQSGALTVTGTTNLASTAANSDILFDTQANNFGGTVVFGGTQANIRDVSLRNLNAGATAPALAGLTNLRNLALTFDAAPINLPTLNASGNLIATAGGSIIQSGALTVGGTTTLTTTVAGSDILFDTQANNFGGAVAFGGTQTNIRDIGIRNLNAGATIPALAGVTSLRNLTLMFDNAPLALPSLTASGNLIATAGGTITQTGALTIAGITTLAAGANDITLNNAVNNFSTVGITSGNNVSLTDNTALDLGTATITGNLDVTTGGALTQSGALNVAGATTLAAGINDIILINATNNFNTVGITSGNNVTLTDANTLTMNASTASGNIAVNAGDLTIGGSMASTGGNLNLTGVNTVTQSANLTAAGANTVTVTTTTGSITMAAAATTTSGIGTITYTAGMDVTLGSLSTSGGVNVSAGGSVLSEAGSGTNVTAGANSTLEAFNGVVGTQTAPMTVNVNPGTLSIRATTVVAGISAFLTGTVLPGNALTLLNVPPGLVCFNGCPATGGTGGSAGLSGNALGTLVYLNPDAIVPTYYPQPSRSVLISDVTSVYIPGSLLEPSSVSLSSENPAVQSLGSKAEAGVNCKQEETVPNQQAAAASFDVRCVAQ